MAALGPRDTIGSATSSELRLRTLSALALAALALVTAVAGGWPLAALWLGAGTVVALEWIAMTGARPSRVLGMVAVFGLAALDVAFLSRSGIALGAVAAGLAAAVLLVAETARDRVWASLGLAYAAAIALVPIALRGHPAGGVAALLWMFAVVWTTDIAAYFVGRALGGPKLWPALSPKKTWSGFAGGVLGGTVAGLAVALAAERAGIVLPAGLAAIALASAIASVASHGGDLAESAMKRRFGVKDSGKLIPGHGGAMDRLDGFAAVALLVAAALLAATVVGASVRP